jgi:hypothetical protein
MRRIYGLLSLVGVVVMLSGCAATRHATHVDKSGFLGEELYEKMKPGDPSKGEVAALRWVDPNRSGVHPNLKRIILDHIVLYRQPQHLGGGESNEASQELLNYFYSKMYAELSKRYEIVDMPGPETIRLQIAVTDYEQSWVALDMISTVIPQLRAVSTLKMLATEKPAFVGGAQIEVKITDAQTGRIVAAGVDRRVGAKTLGKGLDSWADVKHAFDWWSELAAYRLCVTTGGSNCPEKPKA